MFPPSLITEGTFMPPIILISDCNDLPTATLINYFRESRQLLIQTPSFQEAWQLIHNTSQLSVVVIDLQSIQHKSLQLCRSAKMAGSVYVIAIAPDDDPPEIALNS